MLSSWLPIWLLVLDALIRVVLCVSVALRRRQVSVSLAWLILLLLLPVVSSIAYVLVGESRLGTRRALRHQELTRGMEQTAIACLERWHVQPAAMDRDYGHIARFGSAVAGMPPLRGNRLTLLSDNNGMLESLIDDIDQARDHVHLLYYIWTSDAGATRVSDAVIRAAGRGVQCRVLVDGVGSWTFIGSALWNRMRDAGVQMVEALPVNLLRRPFARVDLRNHRKIAVLDGRIAYCGSQNITDTTFRSSKWRHTGQWVDATVRVEGPAAQALALTFLKDWQLDSEEESLAVERYMPAIEHLPDGDCVVQVLPSGPGPTPEAIHQALLTTVYSAREELFMTTPYFVPDESTLSALLSAAARGVAVTMVMPSVSDSLLVAAASRSTYIDLLQAGVRIFHYEKGLLHAKTVTVDRRVGLIGSANLDARSFFLNFEATLFVYDADFVASLRAMQVEYLHEALEVELDLWRKRGRLVTLRDNLAQLLGPLL